MTKEKRSAIPIVSTGAAASTRPVTSVETAVNGKVATPLNQQMRSSAAKVAAAPPEDAERSGSVPSLSAASKTHLILTQLKKPHGATLEELMRITGWQVHSVRGFLSGTVRKKLDFELLRETDAVGVSRYRINEAPTVYWYMEKNADKPHVRRAALSRAQQQALTA